VRSLSWETVLHKLLQSESFPQAATLQELPQRGSFPRGAVFRNRLLQHGSPTGSQALPANLLWRGLLPPRVHRFWQKLVPEQAPHGVTASFRHPPVLVGSFPRATSGYLLHCGPPWAAGGQPASPWSLSQVAREDSPFRHLEHLLPPPFSLTLVSAELFLSHRLTPPSPLPFH